MFPTGTPNGDLVRAFVTHKGTNEEDDEDEAGVGGGTSDDGLPKK